MIKQLAHICIHATDLEKTAWFYTDVLGLEKAFEFQRNGETFGFYLAVGNDTFIEVFTGDSAEIGNIKHVAIQVEDMGSLIARIRQHGITMSEKKRGADHSWQVWVTDPNGVRIEFHEYTSESCQVVGGTCVLNG